METLQISGLDDSPVSLETPGAGYYYDPVTGERYYLYTDPTTGVTHWYKYDAYALGYVYALATRWVVAPKLVTVTVGDSLRIYADFYYVGPAFTGKLYGAIGSKAVGFDEILANSVALSLPKCDSSTHITDKYIDIPITSAIAAGKYAIYIKITDGVALELDKTLSSYYENAVEVIGVKPTFTEFAINWAKTAKV